METDILPTPVKTPEQIEQIESAMRADGVPTETPIQADYFGCDETHKVMLPDKVSWIEHKVMDEGARRKYLNSANRGIRMQRATGDALIDSKPGDDRHTLLLSCIVGWNLSRQGSPVPFSTQMVTQWLATAPPRIVDLVEKDIRLKNPWLQGDMSVEDIQTEINNLTELLESKKREEAGK